jgi:hypothetical protein
VKSSSELSKPSANGRGMPIARSRKNSRPILGTSLGEPLAPSARGWNIWEWRTGALLGRLLLHCGRRVHWVPGVAPDRALGTRATIAGP